MIQIGGVYSTFCQEEGILLPKYRDRNGRCIAILFKSIGVRGRCDSPEKSRTEKQLFAQAFFLRNDPQKRVKYPPFFYYYVINSEQLL